MRFPGWLPVLLVGSLQAENSLVWRNGDALPGRIRSATPGEITWDSPALIEPVTLDRDVLHSIVSDGKIEPGKHSHVVELRDGSRLFGEVSELTGDSLVLASSSLDRVRINRSQVRRIRRMRGADLRWAGPYGKFGWRNPAGEPIADAPSWEGDPATGALRLLQVRVPGEFALDLPDRLECQFVLEATDRPRFAVRLLAGACELRVETWGNTVVLRNGATAFLPLMKLEEGIRRVSLRIFLDAAGSRGLVAGEDGEILGRFETVAPADAAAGEGFRLWARCPDLILREVEIRDWDGSDPEGARDPGEFAFEAVETSPLAPVGRPVDLADTGRFFGELTGVDGSFAVFRTGFCEGGELRVRQANLRRVDLAGAGPVKEPPAKGADSRLTIGDDSLSGEWVPSGNGDLLWRLKGGREPVRLALENEDTMLRIDRRAAGLEAPESVTLAYFRGGEIAAGRLHGMEEQADRFRFESPQFGIGEFEQARLRGIVFDSNVLSASPGEGQWVKLGKGEVSIAKAGITIEPGSALGHPALIQAGRIRIELPDAARRRQLGLRVRLFCDGVDPASASTVFSLRHYAERILVCSEDGTGGILSNQMIRIGRGEPSTVELDWTDSDPIVKVGGNSVVITGRHEGERTGLGVVLEPGYARNTPTPITVEKIFIAESPALTSLPYLDPKARDQVLLVPRFREGREPAHVLVAKNGDALRGTVEAFDGERFRFRSMLDTVTIPGERIAGLVSFGERPPPLGDGPACWVVLRNGARFRLEAPSFGSEWVTGKSALLGNCRLPAGQVRMFLNGEPAPNATAQYLAEFRLRAAPRPDPNSMGGEDSKTGEEAPGFTVDRLGEGEIRLSDFDGKVLVLSFWASWSGPSVRRLGELVEVISEFSENQVQLLAVNQGEPETVIRQSVEARNWKELTIGIDRDREAMNAYGVEVLPTTVVIDPAGRIAEFAAPGEVTAATIRETLARDPR